MEWLNDIFLMVLTIVVLAMAFVRCIEDDE